MSEHNGHYHGNNCAILDDGYTEHGYIKAIERAWPEVRFKFRPMRREQRMMLIGEQFTQLPADTQTKKAAEALAGQLIEWDVKDARGEPLKPIAANVAKLKPQLFERLLSIVAGFSITDVDPEWKEPQQNETFDREFSQAFGSQLPGDAQEEADVKN